MKLESQRLNVSYMSYRFFLGKGGFKYDNKY